MGSLRPSASQTTRTFACVIASLISFIPIAASAATLRVEPATATVAVGESLTLRVMADTNQSLNAISGTLTVPTDLLSIQFPSKGGSLLSLWVQDPSVSGGSVTWSGLIPNPGFTGSGEVLSVTVRALQVGTAHVGLTDGQILANDGNGTNILTAQNGASITIVPATAPPPTIPTTPSAPSIPATLAIVEVPRSANTDPHATFTFTVHNSVKKIDHYTVTIDNGKGESVGFGTPFTFITPEESVGDHTIAVTSVDTQGKMLNATSTFLVSAYICPTLVPAAEFPWQWLIILLLLAMAFVAAFMWWLEQPHRHDSRHQSAHK